MSSPDARRRGDDALLENVARLLTEPPGSSRTVEIADATLDLGEDLALATPVGGTVRIARTNRGVLVTGSVRATLAETCSRCLRPIEVPVAVVLEEEVLPSLDIGTGLPVRGDDEPDAPRLTDHHELDLEPLVREGIQLAEPIAPLCRPDCPGLCVVCGGELADGPHDHPDAPIDPRLEALRAFRRDDEAETG